MDYREITLSALQSLRRNKMRTALTMLGVIIGITSVILIASIGQGAVKFITNELSTFGTNYFQVVPGNDFQSTISGGVTPLTRDDVEAIREEPSFTNIDEVAPFAFTSKKVSTEGEDRSVVIYGVTAEAETLLKPEMIYGEFITEDDNNSNAKIAVLGLEIAEEIFGEDTDPVGESIRIGSKRFKVKGVSKAPGGLAGGFINDAVNIPLNTLITHITGKDEIVEIDISVIDENLIDETIEDVETFMRDRHDLAEGEENDFSIQSFLDVLETVQTITTLLTTMIAGISGISLVVGGVGVMNIMLVSVTERTREIGLLKAIGAKQRDILTQFMIESVVMTMIGGFIGIVLGVSGAYVISLAVGIPFVLSIPWILLAVGMSSVVGVVFGLYPAKRAARLSPIDALRHE